MKLTDAQAIELKIGLLLMSVDSRLALLLKIAEEARTEGDPRWRNLSPQIIELRKQKQTITKFLESREDVPFVNPPEFDAKTSQELSMADSGDDDSSNTRPQIKISPNSGYIGAKHG